MYINCRDISKLPGMENLKLVAGENGLDRSVRWVHIVDVPEVSEWVNGGELIFITGVGLKNGNKQLVDLLVEINNKNLSGLVINIGPYIKSIPNELIDLANELKFPIFEIPFEVKLINLTQIISKAIFTKQMQNESLNSLMKDIIYEEYNEEMLNRAIFHGYNTKKAYITAIIDIDDFSKYIKRNKLTNESEILECKRILKQIISNTMDMHKKSALTMNQSDSFTCIIPLDHKDLIIDTKAKNDKEREVTFILEEIKDKISNSLPGMTVSIGIGGVCNELKKLKESVEQADKALKILNMCNRRDSIKTYKSLGIYRLFFQVENKKELTSLYEEYLAPLVNYDANNSSELVKTLEILLLENQNVSKTADILFIHRNTLKYRITKIEEILDIDLKDANTCFNILLCIKIKRFINLQV
ncbi:PucR family transcriptional regulator [Clostridium grantii]|uniref:DNA-binding transcriptional regulator, PucR family n=1 Tax=Clostridium grantii DSM 8605 TaxID=1121316 RepID=A0A1M5X1H9_9CLOT|nr:PucR family transcriptional regulator [Clostridium grantii]SHH93043.1 DNA-binding transcriptional regulator, PucR family [Clostridium grantii DSM 8605]